MADSDDDSDSRFDDVDLESILARVERRGPLTFTRKRCLYRAPEFVRRLALEETVDEGQTVTFDCKVFAFPKASATWYKDNEEIKDVPNIKPEVLENGEYSITIEGIKKSDEGAYKCKVENPEGSSTCTIYVAVKAKNKSPKKKNPACAVTFPNPFPPITENIEEEEREGNVVATQADSPLTHLYNGVKWKNRTWPDFLGGWDCVHGFHFKDFGESEDDEDVFLSEEFNNNNNDKNIPGIEKIQVPLNNNNSHEDVTNSLTIPNLIFENKNLVKTDANGYDAYDYNYSMLPRSGTDENGNLGTQETTISSAVHITNTMLDEVKTVFSHTDKSTNLEGNKNVILHCTKSSDTKQDYKSENSNYSGIRTRLEVDERDIGYSLFQLESLFLVSAFTLLGLCTNLSPQMFVLYVFIGQLLYCVIRFFLKGT